MACSGNCVGSCTGSCAVNCTGGCLGCGTACSGGCTGACAPGCTGKCGTGCTGGCSGCSGGCGSGCSGCSGCGSGCASSCKGSCKSGCADLCTATCADGCSNTCKNFCNKGCQTQTAASVENDMDILRPKLFKADNIQTISELILLEIARRPHLITDEPTEISFAIKEILSADQLNTIIDNLKILGYEIPYNVDKNSLGLNSVRRAIINKIQISSQQTINLPDVW